MHSFGSPTFSVQQRDRTRFDGGSEVDVLQEDEAMGVELALEQQKFLSTQDPEAWRRPTFPLRDGAGEPLPPGAVEAPRESTYRRRIDTFAVSQCPVYRRQKSLGGEGTTESAADDMNFRRAYAYSAPRRRWESGNLEARGNVSEVVRNPRVARAYPAQGEDNNVAAEVTEDCEFF